MLRTDAEDIEDDEVFIAHVQKMEARRLSPRCRCGNGATDFLRFALLFLFLVLDAMLTPCNLFCLVHTALPFNASVLLLFSLDAALEIDLSHLLWLIAAIVVLVLAGQFVFVFAIIAHHSILDVRTYRIPPTL